MLNSRCPAKCFRLLFYGAIDRGKYVGAIFLDLAEVFDCVDHSILLQKLACYGFGDSAYLWLKSF